MSKKLYIGLAPLLAIAAFAMTPAAAQALVPHWYVNGNKLAEGEVVPVIAWGQLTLESEPAGSAAPTVCENAAGGTIVNPVGGGAGKGQTTRFSTWNCADTECPAGVVDGFEKEFEVISPPQDLPWPSELIGTSPKFKLNSEKVVVELGCVLHGLTKEAAGEGGPTEATGTAGENEQKALAPFVKCETTATHLQDPEAKNGSNAGPAQSTLIFNQPAGSGLICAGTITGRTSEQLKTMGYDNSELITSKNS